MSTTTEVSAVASQADAQTDRTPIRRALSPSRAGDFMTCPLMYRFRVVDRLPEPPSPAAARGTLVHAVAERIFDLPAAERTLVAAVAMLPDTWAAVVAEQHDLASVVPEGTDEAWYAGAATLLKQWFALENPHALQPAERELYVETTLDDGLVLRGYIDRLDVAPDGRMRVVDYKTGRAPGENFEAKALFQMKFYALVLWKLHGRIPTQLQLLYLGSGVVLRYSPDERSLLATERKVQALWAAIERAAHTGDWRATPSKLCDWCAHHDLCPAKGGTPPPVPDHAWERISRSAATTEPPGSDED